GSANGTAVYVETQTPTTNANGLASIEIGSGTLVSGNFATINWANGPYFIKTETDPSGGTNYTITGTSQLLSVPFALYAEKSGNPILQAGSGISIQNDSIINTAPNQQINLSGTGQTNVTGTYPNFTVNTPPYNAGTGINISGTNISAQNTNAIWNANKLQGKNIDTLTPALGNVLQYDGSKWKPSEKLPQMTTAQREALTNLYPGMAILNTNTNCIEYYNGTEWFATCGTTSNVGSSQFQGQAPAGAIQLKSSFPAQNEIFNYLFVINNNIYFFSISLNSTLTFWSYSTTSNNWTQISAPNTNLLNFTLKFSTGNFGIIGDHSSNQFFKYNPTSNLWSTLNFSFQSGVNNPLIRDFAFSDNQYAYLVFNVSNNQSIDYLFKYNPTNDSIIQTSNFNVFNLATYPHHSIKLGNKFFFLGNTVDGAFRFISTYDVSNNLFERFENNSSLAFSNIFISKNKIYLSGNSFQWGGTEDLNYYQFNISTNNYRNTNILRPGWVFGTNTPLEVNENLYIFKNEDIPGTSSNTLGIYKYNLD
ncbi:MAG: hypothetical protein WCI53_14085, partial [Bacteroidota bacterium]